MGEAKQRWFIKVHANQVDVENKKIYFSIHSELHSDRCLTRFNALNIPGEVYSTCGGCTDCTTWRYRATNGVDDFDIYKLQPCTGSNDQSFYLDVPWFTYIDDLRSRQLIE